jgi:uncharacterized phage protein gp47/JayE
MAYIVPTIDASGLHVPSYQDILDYLIAQKKIVYGADIYLGVDALDYQELSVFALMLFDVYQTLQAVYNNRSPLTAIGSALDSIVKLNGLKRNIATNSTVDVVVTGTYGTVITNGVVTDTNSNRWLLPASVTIPIAGTITVTATAEEVGEITALAGTVNAIATPTAGWVSVNNSSSAVAGEPVETDTEFRIRQSISVTLPSITPLEKTTAAIAAIAGVTRYKVYENYTNVNDPVTDIPPHCIAAVVEGGINTDIFQAIYDNRGLGCYMDGDQVLPIVDDNGVSTEVRFYRPTEMPVYVTLDIHTLTGWTATTEDLIIAAIADYINSLQIGEMLTHSALYYAAVGVMSNPAKPTFSIYALGADVSPIGSPMETDDIVINFNEVLTGIVDASPDYILVNYV